MISTFPFVFTVFNGLKWVREPRWTRVACEDTGKSAASAAFSTLSVEWQLLLLWQRRLGLHDAFEWPFAASDSELSLEVSVSLGAPPVDKLWLSKTSKLELFGQGNGFELKEVSSSGSEHSIASQVIGGSPVASDAVGSSPKTGLVGGSWQSFVFDMGMGTTVPGGINRVKGDTVSNDVWGDEVWKGTCSGTLHTETGLSTRFIVWVLLLVIGAVCGLVDKSSLSGEYSLFWNRSEDSVY